jgi:Skp family chaperone for outer membrane proteins
MKKFIQHLLTAVSALGLAQGALAADLKIATVDFSKVFERYYKTIQASAFIRQEVQDMEKERAQMVDGEKKHEEEWRTLIDKANDQATSAEARDRSKKNASEIYSELENDKQSITTFDRVARQRLSEKEHQRRDEIVKEIMGVLNADAKAASYTMVLDTSGASANMTPIVLYSNGQNDFTESLIKELNAAAPPGSLDTNLPPASTLASPSVSPGK